MNLPPVASLYYVLDGRGKLWHGVETLDEARLFLRAQGYPIIHVKPDGTWVPVDESELQ